MHKNMLPWNSDKGAKLCKPRPLSQQVDEDNWIRCVWSLRPRDQSGSTSGQTHAHTHRHTHIHTGKWEHHVDPEKLQLRWLKKPDIHTPARPPGAEPVSPGLSLGRPQESCLTLGHKHPSSPAHPPQKKPIPPAGKIKNTLACVKQTWSVHTSIDCCLLPLTERKNTRVSEG